MNLTTKELRCPCCDRGQMIGELDEGGRIWLACNNDKCGAHLRSDVVANMVGERTARESNRARGEEAIDNVLDAVTSSPGAMPKRLH